MEDIWGRWIVEIADLDYTTTAQVNRVRMFISRAIDRRRSRLSRRVIEAPRQCVFAITVSNSDNLGDETSGRHWWPLRCTRIDLDQLKAERDQLWAEAYSKSRAGETWRVDGAAAAEALRPTRATRLRLHGV